MEVLLVLLCAAALSGVQSIKKCRINCEEKYMPVCGHDTRLGYQSFCSVDALTKCNNVKGNNYTRVADGPCYPSVRVWRAQSTLSVEETFAGANKKKENYKPFEPSIRNSSFSKREEG